MLGVPRPKPAGMDAACLREGDVTRAEAFMYLYALYRGDPDWARVAELLASERVAFFSEADWDLVVTLVKGGRGVITSASLGERLRRKGQDPARWTRPEHDLRRDLL